MTGRDAPLLGIGITTYDRIGRLAETLDGVARHTRTPHLLMVADDGSTDGTPDLLRRRGVSHIAAANRGIAWNKNRLLYYFAEVARCDAIILLEDDTVPSGEGWERPFVEGARLHGHVNFASPGLDRGATSGTGTPADPFRSPVTSGNCAAFGRRAIRAVGFMDTRFRRYGYEHGEHTERMIRAGFGGEAATRAIYLVSSPLTVHEIGARDRDYAADLAVNGDIYLRLREDASLFRPAWRSLAELRALRAELRAAIIREPAPRRLRFLRTTYASMLWPDRERLP